MSSSARIWRYLASAQRRLYPLYRWIYGRLQWNFNNLHRPYFGENDIAELVALAPAPPAELIKGWSAMLYMTTGGGHPVLVTAKIASLRARHWPKDALTEDFGTAPSAAVRLTREE